MENKVKSEKSGGGVSLYHLDIFSINVFILYVLLYFVLFVVKG